MIKYLPRLIVIFLLTSFTLYGSLKSFYNNKITIESFTYEVKQNSSILDLYNGMYESNNFFEKSLFLLGIYLFDFRTIQAGEYLIDDSLFKVLTKMKLGETINYKFVIRDGTNRFDLSSYINTLKLYNDCKDFLCMDLINDSIEGLLLPDTYFYKKNTNLSLLLNKSSTELKNYVDIIWKDKPIVKKQLENWSIPRIKDLIMNINRTEIFIKKNSSISLMLVFNLVYDTSNNS